MKTISEMRDLLMESMRKVAEDEMEANVGATLAKMSDSVIKTVALEISFAEKFGADNIEKNLSKSFEEPEPDLEPEINLRSMVDGSRVLLKKPSGDLVSGILVYLDGTTIGLDVDGDGQDFDLSEDGFELVGYRTPEEIANQPESQIAGKSKE